MPNARRSRRLAATAALAAAAVLATSLAACRGSAGTFGATPAAAAATADRFLAAFAERFTNVVRTPKFFAARSKLARGALTPSRVFDDTTVWTSATPTTRTLVVRGHFADDRYTFDARADAAAPTSVGDSRHTMRLQRLGDDTYEWSTAVDLAAGEVTADQLAALFAGALADAAGRPDAALRAEWRANFPRGAAALGRLFRVDSARGTPPDADGASAITVALSIHPDGLDAQYPAFAQYVRKYVAPARYHLVLRDRAGVRWFDAAAGDDRLTIRLRTVRGRMAPLEGAPRPMPAELTLDAEFFAKVALFTVGVSELHADFAVVAAPQERGWVLRFHESPRWHLPLASARLIRTALRRPFDQGGSLLSITVRDSTGAPTLLARRVRVPVQESTLVRWLGSLAGSAAGDFAGASEVEENRFQADAWNALRADVRAATRVR